MIVYKHEQTRKLILLRLLLALFIPADIYLFKNPCNKAAY